MKLLSLSRVNTLNLATAKPVSNDRQGKRWLATNSSAWARIRLRVLTEEPLCRCGCGQMSVHVDHINGRADRPEDYHRANLQGLAPNCHSRKTAQDQARPM